MSSAIHHLRVVGIPLQRGRILLCSFCQQAVGGRPVSGLEDPGHVAQRHSPVVQRRVGGLFQVPSCSILVTCLRRCVKCILDHGGCRLGSQDSAATFEALDGFTNPLRIAQLAVAWGGSHTGCSDTLEQLQTR